MFTGAICVFVSFVCMSWILYFVAVGCAVVVCLGADCGWTVVVFVRLVMVWR